MASQFQHCLHRLRRVNLAGRFALLGGVVLLCSCRGPRPTVAPWEPPAVPAPTASAPASPTNSPATAESTPASPSPALPPKQTAAAPAHGIAQVNYEEGQPAPDAANCPPGMNGSPGGFAPGAYGPGHPPTGYPAGGYPPAGYAGGPGPGVGYLPYGGNYPGAMLPYSASHGPPLPVGPAIYSANPYGQWQPPRIGGEWPRDEYVFDGGDRNREVAVDYDWTVRGLDLEDTVAHFDTIDGRIIVEPSNRTPIYSPRFAAVRKVYGAVISEGNERLIAAESQSIAMLHEETRIPTTMLQPVEAIGQVAIDSPSNISEKTRGLTVGTQQKVTEHNGDIGPHNDFQIFHRGVFANSEKVRLSQFTEAADFWTENQMAQVLFDAEDADVESGTSASQVVYVNSKIPTHPRLRLVKTASQRAAKPGDIIEFSLRFDNIGDELIGNVTIIDNLSPRLEYVPDSAETKPEAQLYTTVNEGDSLTLRWELAQPLLPGKGGVINFKCRMR